MRRITNETILGYRSMLIDHCDENSWFDSRSAATPFPFLNTLTHTWTDFSLGIMEFMLRTARFFFFSFLLTFVIHNTWRVCSFFYLNAIILKKMYDPRTITSDQSVEHIDTVSVWTKEICINQSSWDINRTVTSSQRHCYAFR